MRVTERVCFLSITDETGRNASSRGGKLNINGRTDRSRGADQSWGQQRVSTNRPFTAARQRASWQTAGSSRPRGLAVPGTLWRTGGLGTRLRSECGPERGRRHPEAARPQGTLATACQVSADGQALRLANTKRPKRTPGTTALLACRGHWSSPEAAQEAHTNLRALISCEVSAPPARLSSATSQERGDLRVPGRGPDYPPKPHIRHRLTKGGGRKASIPTDSPSSRTVCFGRPRRGLAARQGPSR